MEHISSEASGSWPGMRFLRLFMAAPNCLSGQVLMNRSNLGKEDAQQKLNQGFYKERKHKTCTSKSFG